MEELKKYCEKYNVNEKGIEKLLEHLLMTGWKEKDAIEHIKKLFESGFFEELKEAFGGK